MNNVITFPVVPAKRETSIKKVRLDKVTYVSVASHPVPVMGIVGHVLVRADQKTSGSQFFYVGIYSAEAGLEVISENPSRAYCEYQMRSMMRALEAVEEILHIREVL